MVLDMGEANRKWAKLAPPPRWAPPPFRWRWVLHSAWIGVIVGSGAFGVGSLASLTCTLNADPVGACRLAWAAREAPGRLDRTENFGRSDPRDHGVPLWSFRYRYTFRLPDGTAIRGKSYVESPEPLPKDVIVEYDPRDPRINRIRGTRGGPLSLWYLAHWLIPLAGLGFTAGAIRYGLLRLRVLERGESAVGTIVTYTLVLGNREGAEYELPLEEFHRVRATLGAVNPAAVSSGTRPPSGTTMPAPSPSGQRTGVVGPPGVTRCIFEFRTVGGDVVRTRGSVDLGGPLADSPTRTVLYDPAEPRRAILMEELPGWARITPDGVWQAGDDPGEAGRLALLALCWFGGPALGWTFGLIMRATS